jgi:hypothetical protein
MNAKLRKMLENHGVDISVGSIDYWQNEIEMVFAEMHDEVAAAERKACADLVFQMAQLSKYENNWLPLHHAQSAIRARG